jgi:hypothetical protein
LERAVYKQIDEYLQRNKLLYQLQSGFRQCFSTSTCLVYLTDYIKYEIVSGNYVGLVALDVQKAFDCVNHVILCKKLELLGIDSAWFKSYLSSRTQVVVVDGVHSEVAEVKCGVPQGSLLGPLLYLCYCNDMHMATNCKLILYADDSALLFSHKDPKVIEKFLSEELTSVNQWLVENKLCLHPGKCEAILFASQRKCRKSTGFCVKFNNTDIHGANSVKYLGSVIERNLSGKECVQAIIRKAYGRLKYLYRYKHVLSKDIRKILSLSLVQSQMDYACMAWYFQLPKAYKQKLQVVQNRMMRFILDKDHRDHIGRTEFHSINFVNVHNRVTQLSLNIVHKMFYRNTPEYLRSFFIRSSDVHSHNTRNCQYNFKIPVSSVNSVVQKSFSYNVVKAWNALPNNIKGKPQYNCFKQATKHHLVHSD